MQWCKWPVRSCLFNFIIAANETYQQDNGSFGQKVGSLAQELGTGGLSSLVAFAHCNDNHYTCNNPAIVYTIPFDCLTNNNQVVLNLDSNPTDHDCQGILFLEAYYTSNNANQSKMGCVSSVIILRTSLENTSLSNDVIMGSPVKGPGTWYADVISPKKGCSLSLKVPYWQYGDMFLATKD